LLHIRYSLLGSGRNQSLGSLSLFTDCFYREKEFEWCVPGKRLRLLPQTVDKKSGTLDGNAVDVYLVTLPCKVLPLCVAECGLWDFQSSIR